MGEFYSNGQLDTAEKFVKNISEIVPKQYEYEVWIDGVIMYPRGPSKAHNESKSGTRLLLTSKKLTFGIKNKTTSNMWGPYKAEVFLWEQ